jgi:hypothetical protein
MKSWIRAVGITVGAAALVASGIGIASAGNTTPSTPNRPASAASVAHPATPGDIPVDTTASESVFVPMAPCRIVDTRLHGGLVKSARAFLVGGTTGFINQGGTTGGCGIPVGARAIAANIVTVSEVANGYIKAWPTALPAPTASAMNFTKGVALANELTLAINPGAASALEISASQKTQIVIDVTGYYQLQISADIEGNGVFFNHTSRVLSVTHTASSGLYVVTIDHPSEVCSAQATPINFGIFASAITESAGVVDVRIWDLVSGVPTAVDSEFNFTVAC